MVFFSEAESFEVIRLVLSRPPLGRLLTSVWVRKRVSLWVPLQRALLTRVIPSVVRSFVHDLFGMASSSKALWLKLDADGNHLVSKQEFCDLFPSAFWDMIVIPLVNVLAQDFENVSRRIKFPGSQILTSNAIQTAKLNTVQRSASAKANRNCTVVDVSSWCPPDSAFRDTIDSEDHRSAIVGKPHRVDDVEDAIEILEYYEPIVESQKSSKSCELCSVM